MHEERSLDEILEELFNLRHGKWRESSGSRKDLRKKSRKISREFSRVDRRAQGVPKNVEIVVMKWWARRIEQEWIAIREDFNGE